MALDRCWRCGDEQPPAFFCRSCSVVQMLPEDIDLLAVLGLPSHPAVDAAEVERRYYELSRRLHPDRFQTGPADELRASVRATAILNRAFRTLRDSETLGRYWLERLGESLGNGDGSVPPALAAYVFEVQEKLAEARDTRGDARSGALRELDEAKRELDERRRNELARLQDLLRDWPRTTSRAVARDPADVARIRDLKTVLAELSYLRTLERDVRTALTDITDAHASAADTSAGSAS